MRYRLRTDADADREKIERAFQYRMPRPVYRLIRAAIECATELELVET